MGYLARGAQQQAAQREKRERERSEKPSLLHEGNYSRTSRLPQPGVITPQAMRAPELPVGCVL